MGSLPDPARYSIPGYLTPSPGDIVRDLPVGGANLNERVLFYNMDVIFAQNQEILSLNKELLSLLRGYAFDFTLTVSDRVTESSCYSRDGDEVNVPPPGYVPIVDPDIKPKARVRLPSVAPRNASNGVSAEQAVSLAANGRGNSQLSKERFHAASEHVNASSITVQSSIDALNLFLKGNKHSKLVQQFKARGLRTHSGQSPEKPQVGKGPPSPLPTSQVQGQTMVDNHQQPDTSTGAADPASSSQTASNEKTSLQNRAIAQRIVATSLAQKAKDEQVMFSYPRSSSQAPSMPLKSQEFSVLPESQLSSSLNTRSQSPTPSVSGGEDLTYHETPSAADGEHKTPTSNQSQPTYIHRFQSYGSSKAQRTSPEEPQVLPSNHPQDNPWTKETQPRVKSQGPKEGEAGNPKRSALDDLQGLVFECPPPSYTASLAVHVQKENGQQLQNVVSKTPMDSGPESCDTRMASLTSGEIGKWTDELYKSQGSKGEWDSL